MKTTRIILLTIASAGSLLGALHAAESKTVRVITRQDELREARGLATLADIAQKNPELVDAFRSAQERARAQRAAMLARQEWARTNAVAMRIEAQRQAEVLKQKKAEAVAADAPKREAWLKDREARREELRKLEALR